MDVPSVIIKHHGREFLRNAVSDIIKAELKNHKYPNMKVSYIYYVTSVSICHHIKNILSITKYMNMQVPIIHLSNFTIVRNVMQLLKVSWV